MAKLRIAKLRIPNHWLIAHSSESFPSNAYSQSLVLVLRYSILRKEADMHSLVVTSLSPGLVVIFYRKLLFIGNELKTDSNPHFLSLSLVNRARSYLP